MKVLFRTDASIAIGSGHVMRCLALGAALRGWRAVVTFASRDGPGGLCDLVASSGFSVARLSGEPRSSQQTDLDETVAGTSGEKVDSVVIDHYALGSQWQRGARALADRILA